MVRGYPLAKAAQTDHEERDKHLTKPDQDHWVRQMDFGDVFMLADDVDNDAGAEG